MLYANHIHIAVDSLSRFFAN